ncbi:MAG: S8 family serine peptidase, partial [Planctomycetales bacterium]|nr:S8 family serine peptidase [Planctomycetales bacterium]
MTRRQPASAEVYVQFRGNAAARQRVDRLARAAARHCPGTLRTCGALGRLLADGRVVAIEPLFGSSSPGRAEPLAELCAMMHAEKQPEAGTCVLTCQSTTAANAALQALQQDKHVRYAHLGVVKRMAGAVDPLLNRQWALTAIALHQAQRRKAFRPADHIKIGVIDTGVDGDHPDLPAAGIRQLKFTRGVLRDKDGHGTHVIGTIAAVANNRLGIQGVTQSKQLTSLKVMDPFDLRGYFRALRYAIDHRLQVLNLSLEGPATATEQQLIAKAIRRGMVVVAAMGNGGSAQRSYPAAYRQV